MSAVTEITELLTTIAVGVLTAFFISTVFILLLVCKRNRHYYNSYLSPKQPEIECSKPIPDVMLLKPSEPSRDSESEVAVHDLAIRQDIDKILDDDQWLSDVSGLIPHCLVILKSCRSLTERLTALSMGILNTNGDGLRRIVDCARQISGRVDDMVGSMYPPLNPQMLEARAASLTLAVTHLAIITQYECRNKKIPMEWIEKALNEMDAHVTFLHDAANNQDTSGPYLCSNSFSSTTSIN